MRAELRGEPFKVRAYRGAADTVREQRRSITRLAETAGKRGLTELPAIGASIAAKILEFAQTGVVAELEAERARLPIDLLALTAVEGVGPKQARALYDKLGVTDLQTLRAAIDSGRLAQVPGFRGSRGERMRLSLEAGIVDRTQVVGRVWGPALEVLDALGPEVKRRSLTGALRRFDEIVPFAQFLAASREPSRVLAAFHAMEGVDRSLDEQRFEHINGFVAELEVVEPDAFGAALLFSTGSEAHVFGLKTFAELKGLELRREGLFERGRRIAGETETSIYEALGLPFVPPELRDGEPEFSAIMQGGLPDLVDASDIKGDLQTQSDWSDGRDSIEALVDRARGLDYEYLAITDHTQGLGVAGGLDPARLLAQGQRLDALNQAIADLHILKGAEVNVLEDGSLDMPDEVLTTLDVVGAAVHSHFGLDRASSTRRVIRAIEHPLVDVYFHPTARVLGRRPPIALDLDAVIAAAVRTGTALEVDAFASRLDFSAANVRRAVQGGACLMIDSDAHRVEQLDWLRQLGVPLARRGWAEKKDVVNTRSRDDFLGWLASRRRSALAGATPR